MNHPNAATPLHDTMLCSMDVLCLQGADPVEALTSANSAAIVWLHAKVQELTLLVMELSLEAKTQVKAAKEDAVRAHDRCSHLESNMQDVERDLITVSDEMEDLRFEVGL